MMSDIGLGLAIIADSLPAKSPMSLNGKGRYLTRLGPWERPLVGGVAPGLIIDRRTTDPASARR